MLLISYKVVTYLSLAAIIVTLNNLNRDKIILILTDQDILTILTILRGQ